MEENEFVLAKIHTDENGSDMLTKVLPTKKLIVCRQRTSLVDSPPTRVKGESAEKPNGDSARPRRD